MIERDKTLKEKVMEARRYLAGFPDHESDVIYQALTALEERVEELEVDIDYYMCLLPADSPLILDKHKEARDAEE